MWSPHRPLFFFRRAALAQVCTAPHDSLGDSPWSHELRRQTLTRTPSLDQQCRPGTRCASNGSPHHSADLPTTTEGGPTANSTSVGASREPRHHFVAKKHRQTTIPMAYMPDTSTSHPRVTRVYFGLVGITFGYAGGDFVTRVTPPDCAWAVAGLVALALSAPAVVAATATEVIATVVEVVIVVVVGGRVVVNANSLGSPLRETQAPAALPSRSKEQRPDAPCTVG
mmetsp:Transcript_89156/g.238832  ORF Transcript_89156/g.238832 Transcript_89156/m.238832 type:complete len:226 (-) Transcript_89156:1484-2161(-)